MTGASRGIGEAIAAAFAREGAEVIITSRKPAGIEAAAERIATRHPGCAVAARVCHAGDPESIEALFDWLDQRGSTADILVNNAATNPYFGPLIDASWGAWDKTFEVNLRGPFHASRLLARRLFRAGRGGAIVNVSSIFGLRAAPLQGLYAMTKAALIAQTRTLAAEWGESGIRVNAVAPGLIDTRFASAIVDDPGFSRMFTERSALGRVGQPEDVAGLVLFLASEEARFITGGVYTADGGYTSS